MPETAPTSNESFTEGPLAPKTEPAATETPTTAPTSSEPTNNPENAPNIGDILMRVADKLDAIDQRLNSNAEPKEPQKVEVALSSGGNMQPAGTESPAALSWDDLKSMSEKEINSRWKEVRALLDNPPSGK